APAAPAAPDVSGPGTPAPEDAAAPPAEAQAEPAQAPAAGEAAAVPATDVVTLVAWYVTDGSGEFLNILPISVDPALVAGELAGSRPIGVADFPDDGAPTITLGETEFMSYPRGEGDIPERWVWFDDFEGARPATLVMQVEGKGGPYAGYFGSVTFVSRDEGGVGGAIVFALRPPDSRQGSGADQQSAGAEPAAADPAAAAPDAEAAEPSA
ncbi:MAG: hypothetical protein ACKOWF_10985, partial [Chloroflexota bacterium]